MEGPTRFAALALGVLVMGNVACEEDDDPRPDSVMDASPHVACLDPEDASAVDASAPDCGQVVYVPEECPDGCRPVS